MPIPLSSEEWAKLEDLFVSAADLGPEARRRFLDTECATEPELRAELESLFRYDTAQQPEVEAALGAGAAWVVDGEALEGRTLGAYRIERELGRGGMSVVYLAARDDGEFRKQVAIKLIKRGMDTDAVVGRLRRERRILAALEHPYIARLLDGGTTPDTRPYIVMEHVDGLPIDRYCDAHSLDVPERCALIEKVCEAVSYAHRNLVVHRDLKPANILVTADGTPRLLDFGIARVLEGDSGEQPSPETRSFSPALTPEYASPEQFAGIASGTGADVYSLGVVLYELLAGSRPYGAETAACGREPERASVMAERGIHSVSRAKQIRGDLDNILGKAIQRDPAHRYLSIEQFQQDLNRFWLGLPVAARGDSTLYRLEKFVTRHRFAAIAATAAVLALVGGLGATLWQARAAQAARQVAEARRRDAEASAKQSAAALARAEAEHAEAENQRKLAELQQVAAETQRAAAERRFGELHDLARTFTIDFDKAITPLAGAVPARKMLVETGLRYYDSLLKDAAGNKALLEEIADAYDHLGDVEGNPSVSNLGDPVAAMRAYEKAGSVRSRISDESPGFVASVLGNSVRIGMVQAYNGDMSVAFTVTEAALHLGATSPAAADPGVRLAMLRLWTNLGNIRNQADEFEQALAAYSHVLELATEYQSAGLSEVDGRSMISLANTKLGEVLAQMGHGPEALQHLRVALAIDEEFRAKEPDSIPRLRKVYVDYFMMNYAYASASGAASAQPEEIRLSLAKGAELADRIAAIDSGNITVYSDMGLSHWNYANWYRAHGDFQNALAEMRRYYAAYERYTNGQSHDREFDDARVRADAYLARALAEAGSPDEALPHLTKASDLLASMEKTNPGMPHLRHQAATDSEIEAAIWSAQKNWARAIAAHREAQTILDQLLESNPKDDNARDELLLERQLLAVDLANAGQTADARASLESALTVLRESAASRTLTPSELKFETEARAKIAALK